MFSPCIICSSSTLPTSVSNKTEHEPLLKRFFQLLRRHLGPVWDGHEGIYNNENSAKAQIPLWQPINNTGMSSCEDCSKIMQSFCELYSKMKSTELLLNWKLRTLTNKLAEGQKNIKRTRIKDYGGDKIERIISDEIIDLKRDLVRKCRRKLEISFPRLVLRKWRPSTDEVVELRSSTLPQTVETSLPTLEDDEVIVEPENHDTSHLHDNLKTEQVELLPPPPLPVDSDSSSDPEENEDMESLSSDSEYYNDEEDADCDEDQNATKNYKDVDSGVAGCKIKVDQDIDQKLFGSEVKTVRKSVKDYTARIVTGSKPKVPIPIVVDAIVKYRQQQLRITARQIRKKLLADRICSKNNLPPNTLINRIWRIKKGNNQFKSGTKFGRYSLCQVSNCWEVLLTKDDITNHRRLHGEFSCFFCDSTFEYAPDLSEHEVTAHPSDASINDKNLRCPRPNCSYRYMDKVLYIRHHLSAHMNLTPNRLIGNCYICNSVPESQLIQVRRKQFRIHYTNFHNLDNLASGESVQKCDQGNCTAYFLTPLQLRKHKINFHDVRDRYPCPDCNASYSSSFNLQNHQVRKHGTNFTFSCGEKGCVKKFQTEAELRRHSNITHSEKMKRLDCPICSKTVWGQAAMIMHMKMHASRPEAVTKASVVLPIGDAIVKYKQQEPTISAHQIRKKLLRDGICSKDTLPSASYIYGIWKRKLSEKAAEQGKKRRKRQPALSSSGIKFRWGKPDCDRIYPDKISFTRHQEECHLTNCNTIENQNQHPESKDSILSEKKSCAVADTQSNEMNPDIDSPQPDHVIEDEDHDSCSDSGDDDDGIDFSSTDSDDEVVMENREKFDEGINEALKTGYNDNVEVKPHLVSPNKASQVHPFKSGKHSLCEVENCLEVLFTEEDISNHRKLHGEFSCLFCDSTFDYAPDLSEHEITAHPSDALKVKNTKMLRCPRPNCSNRYNDRVGYIRHHLSTHMNLTPNRLVRNCYICNSVPKSQSIPIRRKQFSVHYNFCHNLDNLANGEAAQKCNQGNCTAYFLTPSQLRNHKINFHDVMDRYPCPDCNASYCSPFNLQMHQVRKHEMHCIFPCKSEGCGRKFKTEAELRRHMSVTHRDNNKFECPKCKKIVWGPGAITNHMRMHASRPSKDVPGKYVCEKCGKAFKTNEYLKKHYLSHSGPSTWQFSCDVCSKKCLDKHKLNEHMRTHSKLKSFICEICGQKYAHRHNLRIHVNSKHGDKVRDVARNFNKRNLTSRKGIKRKKAESESLSDMETSSDSG